MECPIETIILMCGCCVYREAAARDYVGGTLKVNASPDSALGFLRKTLPGFDRIVEIKTVVRLRLRPPMAGLRHETAGAALVTGYDPFLSLWRLGGVGLRLIGSLPREQYDLVPSNTSPTLQRRSRP
jgi:hypothetical protein